MRFHQAVGSLVSVGVAVISGSVALLLTYTLGKAAFAEPRSLEAFGVRLRHYTDRLEVSADGSLRLIRYPHPVLLNVGMWLASVLVLVASVYMLRRYARPRLANHKGSRRFAERASGLQSLREDRLRSGVRDEVLSGPDACLRV
jgi:hypothetical protein